MGFLALFLLALVGQAVAGHARCNDEEVAHARMLGETPEPLSLARYAGSSAFWSAVMENWQSEYLQFALFVLATVWLVQRGSTESKDVDEVGREPDEAQLLGEHAGEDAPAWARAQGWRRRAYENSLLIVMGAIFLLSWLAHSITGWSEYNAQQLEHEERAVSWLGYVGTPSLWSSTLENWQSEFLAVGSMAVLSIYLRQRDPRSPSPSARHIPPPAAKRDC